MDDTNTKPKQKVVPLAVRQRAIQDYLAGDDLVAVGCRYGVSNDTEAANRDTKRRIQQQLLHVADQGLRVWTTHTSYNAQTYARNMRKRGEPNVIDMTPPNPPRRPDPPPTG